MAAMAPERSVGNSMTVAEVKKVTAAESDAQDEVRFRAFTQMRRAERQRLQEIQDAQRNRVRKHATTALAITGSAAAAPRPTPTRIHESAEKLTELLGSSMSWESVHRSALGSCVDPSGMVRSGCVPTLLRLAENVDNVGDRQMILQALEATALEKKRLARFLELGGAVVIGRWLVDANANLTLGGVAQAAICTDTQEGDFADTVLEFALLCLRVVGLLPLTAEEACTSGIVEACRKMDGSCPQVQQMVASLMVQWQLPKAAAPEQVQDVKETSVHEPTASDQIAGPLGQDSLDSLIDAIVDDIMKFEAMVAQTAEDRCAFTPPSFRSRFQELAELLGPCINAQDCKLPSSSVDKIRMLVRKLHGFMGGADMSIAKGLADDLGVAMPRLQRVIASFAQACPKVMSEGTNVDTANKLMVSPGTSQIREVLPEMKVSTASHRWDCFINNQTQLPIEL